MSNNLEPILANNNNLNVYIFGSHLYGTNNENSDIDLIVIQEEYKPIENVNVHCYTLQTFQNSCNNGDIVCLEIYFYKKSIKQTVSLLPININLENFRRNNSMLSSNSWVKGKKKLIVIGDYDLNIGLKSIFHSLRILDYCIQIGEAGKIYDFTRDSYILSDLFKLSESYQKDDLWNIIDTKYRGLFNNRKSLFKQLFPIEKQTEKLYELEKILIKYNCFNESMFEEIKSLL